MEGHSFEVRFSVMFGTCKASDHELRRDKGPEGTYLRHNHGDEIAGKEKIKQWFPKDRILFDTSIFGHPQAAAKLSFSTAKEDGDPTPWLRGTRL